MASLTDIIRTRLQFSKEKGMTMTGQPANDIEIAPLGKGIVKEESESDMSSGKKAVFTFGRFNPPTTGHQKLIDAVKNHAEKTGADHIIYASHSQDPVKNPLSHGEKVDFMNKMFPDTNVYHSAGNVRNIFDAVKHLQKHGYNDSTLVVGDDRVNEFKNLLNKYNKNPNEADYDPNKHFYMPKLRVVSAGHRDPDAEGVEGMSASKLRAHAQAGNFKEFKKGVPAPEHAEDLYNTLRRRMNINEALTEQSAGLLNTTGTRTPQEIRTMKTQRLYDKITNKLQQAKANDAAAAAKEDEDGRKIAKRYKTVSVRVPSDSRSTSYESVKYNVPMERDKMAPGPKPVDIGYDKDIEPKDTDKQLRRRQTLKRFRTVIEEIGVAATSKPSPIVTPLPPASVKARPKKVEEKVLTPAEKSKREEVAQAIEREHPGMPMGKKMAIATATAKKVAEDTELEEKRGLWDNIHAKRERIKRGSGERMRKPGSKGAPTAADFKAAQESVEYIEERGADSKGLYRSTESGAGLTKKGVAHFRRQNPGSKLQTAVTEKNPKGKRAARRRSFCARMGGMPGPMKDEKGRPTRKAMSLRRWRC